MLCLQTYSRIIAATDFRVEFANRLFVLAGVVKCVKNSAYRIDPGAFFVIPAQNGPWRMGKIRALQRFGNGAGISVPFLETLDINPAELPLLQRVFFPVEEPFQLGRPPDVQPEF